MAVKPTSVHEDTLQTSGDEPLKCYVDASGLHLTSTTAGVLATIDASGNLAVAGTIGGTEQLDTVSKAVTASTTQTQGHGALTSVINHVTVCANDNDTITLPSAVAGLHCYVFNDTAHTLKVFPASGDKISGGTTDAAVTQATTVFKHYMAEDGTNWLVR